MVQIFFDQKSLKAGEVYELLGPIKTTDGEDYELSDWIDRGGHATVFKCINKRSGDLRAVKFLLTSNHVKKKRFQRELELIKKLKHPHIISCFGDGKVFVRFRNKKISIHFLVMEIADSNLQGLMRSRDHSIPYEDFIGQFRGLTKALAHIHETAIHRDIKPENILICGDKWLLSDYGLCSSVVDLESDLTPEDGVVGPKFWMSPESQNKRLGIANEICKASDVYQLAAIAWYIINQNYPCGILTEEDWVGPKAVRTVIMNALSHAVPRRPMDGKRFSEELEAAVIQ